ncbi:S-adenosyl-L-methionine-dependent methyltransferase [Lichtheimia hyalospora FSU 10163]|nr:S-adenosyl-L-methionine-dependent methyltransferase [Lichtheimia hyalospora FSU 10163]
MGNTPSDLQWHPDGTPPPLRRSTTQRTSGSNRSHGDRPPGFANFFEAAAVSTAPSAPPPRHLRQPKREGSCSTVSTNSTLSSTSKSLSQKTPPNGPSRMPSEASTSSTVVQADVSSLDKSTCNPSTIDNHMHTLLKRVLGGLCKAPVHRILSSCEERSTRPNVLEIGCGQGSWIIDMATEFPKADFHGIDTSLPEISLNAKRKNAYFKEHTSRKEPLSFSDDTFDYIYMRMLLCRFTHSEWTQLLKEIMRVLKPGGYLEIIDLDYTVKRAGSRCNDLINHQMLEMMLKEHQIDLQRARHLPTWLQTDFVDIQQERMVVPLSWTHTDHTVVQSLFAKIDAIPPDCQKQQPHCVLYTCYGRKPTNTLDDTWDTMVNDFASGYID